jgi:Zn-dependent protease
MLLSGLEPATIFANALVLVVAFTVHEFAHAWTADYFGDSTPRRYGRLTLDPRAHLDPMGSLLLLFAGFGWAKPVPIDPYLLRRRSPAAVMLVSIAGPLSNLALAALAAIPFRLGLLSPDFPSGTLPNPAQVLTQFVLINLVLLLFNLIPIAPLDGEKIADYFFPPSWARFMDTIRPYGPLILLAVVFIGPYLGLDILSWIIGPPLRALFSLLMG